jgi:hypothetical protein
MIDSTNNGGRERPTTQCTIHGADKEDILFIFAQRHGLYINVVGNCLLDG